MLVLPDHARFYVYRVLVFLLIIEARKLRRLYIREVLVIVRVESLVIPMYISLIPIPFFWCGRIN